MTGRHSGVVCTVLLRTSHQIRKRRRVIEMSRIRGLDTGCVLTKLTFIQIYYSRHCIKQKIL